MGYKLREIAAESKFSQELTIDAIAQAVPLSAITAALTDEAVCAPRERKLNMMTTVLVTIAMSLYARISIGEVLKKVAKAERRRDLEDRLELDRLRNLQITGHGVQSFHGWLPPGRCRG